MAGVPPLRDGEVSGLRRGKSPLTKRDGAESLAAGFAIIDLKLETVGQIMQPLLHRSVTLLTLLSISALAHHSPARFRVDQVVAVDGRVLRVDWTNPHTYLFVEDGDGQSWRFEANSTSIMRRAGWTRDTLEPGEAVVVRANPGRDAAARIGRLLSVARADGTVLSGSSPAAENAFAGSDDIQGVWRGNAEQAFEFLFAYLDHPVTDKAARAMADYDESMDPITDCATWPTPRLTAWTAFYLSEIEVHEDRVRILNEFDRTERIVFLDGRGHPADDSVFPQGHSIGRWDGDTLIVDTANFAPSVSPVANGIPSGSGKRVQERFTLSEDGRSLAIDIRVEDPEYLEEPFETELTWQYSPTLSLSPFECDPEISKRFLN